MGGADQFCLRWNEFQSKVSNAFKELREEKEFFDVTLACDDGQVEAHKVILSACSPFFRDILRRNPHQHPLLYLKGVKFLEVASLLDFMYQGEVNVGQNELSSFLAVAEELKVKGLTQNNTGETEDAINNQKERNERQHSRELSEEDTNFPPSKKQRTVGDANFQNSEADAASYNNDRVSETDIVSETNTSSIKPEPEITEDSSSLDSSSISPLKLQGDLKSSLMTTPRMSGVMETFGREDNYGFEQFCQDNSGIMNHTGLDANKVKMKSPSKLYGNWTIHHHPGDSPSVPEDDLGHNTIALDSMDSNDFFADPTTDWDAVVAAKITKKDNFWRCLECSYMARNKTSVVSHVQGKHLEGFGGYICRLCGGKSGTYCGFEKHMSRQHKFSLARKNSVNSILAVKFEDH